jgi:hypothetical protein
MYYLAMRLSKTQNLIEDTKAEFQQYQDEQITDRQAMEIQHNMFGVMELLLKWNNTFIEEGKKILQRLRQLISAKDRQTDLDLMLNNEEETDKYKMREVINRLK